MQDSCLDARMEPAIPWMDPSGSTRQSDRQPINHQPISTDYQPISNHLKIRSFWLSLSWWMGNYTVILHLIRVCIHRQINLAIQASDRWSCLLFRGGYLKTRIRLSYLIRIIIGPVFNADKLCIILMIDRWLDSLLCLSSRWKFLMNQETIFDNTKYHVFFFFIIQERMVLTLTFSHFWLSIIQSRKSL